MENKEINVKLAKLYGAVEENEVLKKRLQTEPELVLKEFGIEVPPNVKISVHENTKDIIHLVIPMKSGLNLVSGGATFTLRA